MIGASILAGAIADPARALRQAGLVIVAVMVVGLACWALLERAGRLGAEGDLADARTQVSVLAGELDEQTRAVEDLEARGRAAVEAGRKARAAVESDLRAHRTRADALAALLASRPAGVDPMGPAACVAGLDAVRRSLGGQP